MIIKIINHGGVVGHGKDEYVIEAQSYRANTEVFSNRSEYNKILDGMTNPHFPFPLDLLFL